MMKIKKICLEKNISPDYRTIYIGYGQEENK